MLFFDCRIFREMACAATRANASKWHSQTSRMLCWQRLALVCECPPIGQKFHRFECVRARPITWPKREWKREEKKKCQNNNTHSHSHVQPHTCVADKDGDRTETKKKRIANFRCFCCSVPNVSVATTSGHLCCTRGRKPNVSVSVAPNLPIISTFSTSKTHNRRFACVIVRWNVRSNVLASLACWCVSPFLFDIIGYTFLRQFNIRLWSDV